MAWKLPIDPAVTKHRRRFAGRARLPRPEHEIRISGHRYAIQRTQLALGLDAAALALAARNSCSFKDCICS